MMENSMFYGFTYSIYCPFAMVGLKVVLVYFNILIQFGHHIKCILTTKLTGTTIWPELNMLDADFISYEG